METAKTRIEATLVKVDAIMGVISDYMALSTLGEEKPSDLIADLSIVLGLLSRVNTVLGQEAMRLKKEVVMHVAKDQGSKEVGGFEEFADQVKDALGKLGKE